MKIENYDELKFTSIKANGAIVHFKYKDEHFTVINGNLEETSTITLLKGRCKHNTDTIKCEWGFCIGLIKYINKKRTLKYIDKSNFVLQLVKSKILEPTDEQKSIIIKEEKMKNIKSQIKKLQNQLDVLNNGA